MTATDTKIAELLVAAGTWTEDEATKVAPRIRAAILAQTHGTPQARQRHLDRGEPLCEPCAGSLRHTGPLDDTQVHHGTPRGYRWHRRHRTEACEPCRRAWARYRADTRHTL